MSNEGKKVKVHYVGTLDDGTKFDSSRDRNEPLAFTCMAGQMIPGFDKAVKDMTIGQIVDIHIPAAEAYGERHEEAGQPVPVAQLPGSESLVAGQQVTLGTPEGYPVMATVVSNDGTTIVFDTNHPMAGKDLNFNIELLEVEE